MKIPPDCRLYYISDIQIRRLKMLKATVVAEIEQQQYISDQEEARLKEDLIIEDMRADEELDRAFEESERENYDPDIPSTIPDN